MGSRERARAHAKRASFCTCGKVVRGNGARWQHFEMHRRRGDGHHGITQDAHAALRDSAASCSPMEQHEDAVKRDAR